MFDWTARRAMTEIDAPRRAFARTPRWIRGVSVVLLGLLALYAGLFWFLRNPTLFDLQVTQPSPVPADAARLKRDVSTLASIKPSRSIQNMAALLLSADHIEAEFAATGCLVERHIFQYSGQPFRNISCSFGPTEAARVLLGAHYDVFQYSRPSGDDTSAARMPGADDNASGVAAILELARLIGSEKPELPHRVELVAFTLEEFVEENKDDVPVSIGSHRYVLDLKQRGVALKLMVSVEMVGYFDDRPGSQTFPSPLSPVLSLYYPTTGNFIGVIGRSFDRAVVSRVRGLVQVSDRVPVYSINAPTFVPGIDRSDHKNFWAEDYPAVMVTDTAEFRNPNYHTPRDTADTLDYDRMAVVVEGLYRLAVGF